MEGGKELPRNFLEVLGNNLEFGEVGGVFSIGAGAAAEKDVVNVGGKAREGGDNSGLLSVQGYTIVGAHPLDLLLHLGHPLLVHFLTQVKNGSSDVDQGEEILSPLFFCLLMYWSIYSFKCMEATRDSMESPKTCFPSTPISEAIPQILEM